jgi:hypothetical protein
MKKCQGYGVHLSQKDYLEKYHPYLSSNQHYKSVDKLNKYRICELCSLAGGTYCTKCHAWYCSTHASNHTTIQSCDLCKKFKPLCRCT